jgi:DNA replicative helicase MCM subunit Mcm2 (Cdc46/Mcm family)
VSGIIRRHGPRKPKPLKGVIDVWKCLECGYTVAQNADAQTFSGPAPLECKRCPGQPDMQAGRYYSTVVASSRPSEGNAA